VSRLHRFLAAKNRDAARRAVSAIRESISALEQHPDIGRRVEGMDPELREWIISFGRDGYLVLYRHDGRDLLVLTIRHGREAGY
jgi:plasmid stabilization system protein ParE